jgi:hypothetical protein
VTGRKGENELTDKTNKIYNYLYVLPGCVDDKLPGKYE